MPLRKSHDLELFAFGHIYFDTVNVDPDTGVCRVGFVDQCVKLPDKKFTDLKTVLKAGVNLEQVNCKLLDPAGTLVFSDDVQDEIKQDDKGV